MTTIDKAFLKLKEKKTQIQIMIEEIGSSDLPKYAQQICGEILTQMNNAALSEFKDAVKHELSKRLERRIVFNKEQ